MKGQWTGAFSGNQSGDITIEIDENDENFSGRACVFEEGNAHFLYVVEFDTLDKSSTQSINAYVSIQRVGNVSEVSRVELGNAFPNVSFPDRVKAVLKMTQRGLRISATTYAGSLQIGNITALLGRGSADRKSKIATNRKIVNWNKFKAMVGDLHQERYIFRGQPVCNRLRTSFHRTNRRDLNRFISNDIRQLHAVVSSRLRHYFELKDDIQNAAFWNLLQHHGYPTPLLDWTHSPYVAAYFAYRELARSDSDPRRKVRIFKFDRVEWTRDFPQLSTVVNVRPHFSILNPVALENPRALPQQAICSVTTVDDVEEYLVRCGKLRAKKYIEVFELPYSERSSVLSELRLMGVAAGSLFPGIDGACEEMRLRNFRV